MPSEKCNDEFPSDPESENEEAQRSVEVDDNNGKLLAEEESSEVVIREYSVASADIADGGQPTIDELE